MFRDPKGAERTAPPHRLHGVYPALVSDLKDLDRQARVQVMLPWVSAEDGRRAKVWARLSTLMAGDGRGTWFVPEVGDEVLIAFMAGDPRWPVVLGSLWNGRDAPPESMDPAGENWLRSITSESGHKLVLDDTPGGEKVRVLTQGGHEIVLDDVVQEIRVTHLNGAEIKVDIAGAVYVTALTELKVDAPAGVEVNSSVVTINALMTECAGALKSQTLETGSVNAQSYNNAPGNLR